MSDPLTAWLAAQREFVERWLTTSQSAPESTAAAQSELQRWWQAIMHDASPGAQEVAQQLLALGPGFLAGTGDALFDLFGARSPDGAAAPFTRWLDIAPIGYTREHQAHAQELARALDEYRRLSEQMAGAVARIHTQALELLSVKLSELGAQGQSVDDTARLYALWIECGERAFADAARAETFGHLQGQLVNAAARVRMAQQTIAEQLSKSLDLPTRAELNSVHKRLKDMRNRLEQLESRHAESSAPANERPRTSRSKRR